MQTVGDFVHHFHVVALIVAVFVNGGIGRVVLVCDDVQSFFEVVQRLNFNLWRVAEDAGKIEVNAREDCREDYRQGDCRFDESIFFRCLCLH